MGSLMSGWGSRVPRLQSGIFSAISSFLNLSTSLTRSPSQTQARLMIDCVLVSLTGFCFQKGIDRPLVKEEESAEPPLKKHGWWICSKWAFLNEPPKRSWETSYNYVAQFHIARKHIDSIDR
ncbi:hypothetical protein L1987_47247 [Smallanthus sonchifolius]|uniref:Uncharacterized protein n=1 Tax=Smallanthus sonchifolius TaxID=185202 RepID=A0ACB9G3S0_9ASTR|nr:hypothetical protein L1987_47247 [Smallanthus sonchifolius]